MSVKLNEINKIKVRTEKDIKASPIQLFLDDGDVVQSRSLKGSSFSFQNVGNEVWFVLYHELKKVSVKSKKKKKKIHETVHTSAAVIDSFLGRI